MDELIQLFVDNYFTDEFQIEVRRSFDLFDAFEYNGAFTGFIDIATNQSNLASDDMRDQFVQELHERLNYILTQHKVKLTNETTIYEKNEFLTALMRVQALEDYTGIIRTLETFEADEVQLAGVISELCMLEEHKVMEIVESFNPRMLKILKQFIYAKEEAMPQQARVEGKIVSHIKMFNHVFGETNIGSQLVRGQILMGQRFETYIDYIQDIVIGDTDSATALNILSVLYLSIDGFNNVLMVYRKYSYRLLQDLDKVSRVEVCMLNHIAKLNEYLKAADEKRRLSQTVIEA